MHPFTILNFNLNSRGSLWLHLIKILLALIFVTAVEDLELLGIVSVAGATIGALTSLGLSFTALSPLVIGGIVGFVTPALLAVWCIGALLYKLYKKGCIEKDHKEEAFFLGIVTPVSAAIGVGLAAAATAIFPGAMLGMGSAALAGATIGVIAPIAGLLATAAIISAAEKVNEYIISPIVECFSSKEKEV